MDFIQYGRNLTPNRKKFLSEAQGGEFNSRESNTDEIQDIIPEGFKMTEIGPIPEHWQVVRLGEAITYQKGRKPEVLGEEPLPGSLPYLTAEYFRTGQAKQFLSEGDFKHNIICESSDIALIWDGSNAGDTFTGLKGVLASTMVRIRPDASKLDHVFAFFYLKTRFDELNNQTTGSTIPHVNKNVFENLLIPLPPLSEQRAIAQVLRTVQRAKEATERVIQATRELKKSLMRHLFTYGPVPLAEADRVPLKETEIGPIPEHWQVVRLGEVADVKGGKRLLKGHKFSDHPTPYPYIRVVDFKNGSVDKANLRFLTPQDHEIIKRYTISARDVYISIAGTIGLVGTIPPELDGANLTENAAKIVFKNPFQVEQRFVVYYLTSESGQEQISLRTTKTSQPKLALARINQTPIPLPPLPEQREIARILQAVDQKIQAEEKSKKAIEILFGTLLQHLMTGKIRAINLKEE